MPKEPANKSIRKKSEYTVHEVGVLLEKVASGVSGVADGVMMNAERLDRVDKRLDQLDNRLVGFEKNVNARFDRLELRMDRLEGEVRAIRSILGSAERPNVITREEHVELERRLARVEATLAKQR